MTFVLDARAAVRGTSLHPPEVEAEFRRRFLTSEARFTAVLILALTLPSVPLFLNDLRFAEARGSLGWLSAMRVSDLVLSLLAGLSLWRVKRSWVVEAWTLGYVLMISLESVGVQSTRPIDYLLPVMLEVALTVMVWMVMPLRFWQQVLGAAALAASAATWLSLFRRPLAASELSVLVVTFTSVNAIGAYGAWRGHGLKRSLFLEAERLAQDIARREEAERALAESQAEVKRLSGLLSICMYCKKIRNDAGQWEVLEHYIQTRTDSRFSHGLCEDCYAQHHPE